MPARALRDVFEEEDAAGGVEKPAAAADGFEAPALWRARCGTLARQAEHLELHAFRRRARAVDFHERRGRAVQMDGAGDHLAAAATFTANQDPAAAGRRALHQVHDQTHGRRIPDDPEGQGSPGGLPTPPTFLFARFAIKARIAGRGGRGSTSKTPARMASAAAYGRPDRRPRSRRLGILRTDRARDAQRLAVLAKIDQAQGHRVREVVPGIAAVNVYRGETELPQQCFHVVAAAVAGKSSEECGGIARCSSRFDWVPSSGRPLAGCGAARRGSRCTRWPL